jgi:hypothetical protein
MTNPKSLSRLKVSELEEMARSLGIDPANCAGKVRLIDNIMKKISPLEDGEFNQFVDEEENEVLEEAPIEVVVPTPVDPGWTDYFLSHLTDNELKKGNPTVDGIRRVTEKLYGEILASHTEVLEHPCAANNWSRCVAMHNLQIRKYANDELVSIQGVVDVKYQNIPQPYCEHLVATADTRAEGKALRRALKLNIVTAEEVNVKEEDDVTTTENINDAQIVAINQLCKRLDINVNKLLKTSYNKEDINGLSHAVARQLLHDLSNYQRNKKSIPAEVIGYDPDWKKKE